MRARPDNTLPASDRRLRHALLMVASILAAFQFLIMHQNDYLLWAFSTGRSLSTLLSIFALTLALYYAAMFLLAGRFQHRPGRRNDLAMMAPVLQFVAILAALAATLHIAGVRPASWAALAGFGGLLMGWSLQAPVSGLAAWLLICVKRPFRVGDRVKLQAWDLRGDITHIGMMYTELNQVGGTVGSEDLAGHTILVPNAMLFQNIVVNYTPQQAAAFLTSEWVERGVVTR